VHRAVQRPVLTPLLNNQDTNGFTLLYFFHSKGGSKMHAHIISPYRHGGATLPTHVIGVDLSLCLSTLFPTMSFLSSSTALAFPLIMLSHVAAESAPPPNHKYSLSYPYSCRSYHKYSLSCMYFFLSLIDAPTQPLALSYSNNRHDS
jgi:hypothetical protein